jgi:aspartate aminotransferase
MKLADRMSRVSESATLRVARRADELRRQGASVVDFGAGEPDFASPPVAVAAAQRALAEGFTKYTQNAGTPELREAVARRYRERYGAPYGAADVVITVGAKAALFELALALFDQGDEVVLPAPCWVSFAEQIRLAGARPVLVPLSREDGFRIHAEPLLAAITDRTRAILLNSPSNPTGGTVSAEDLGALVEACAERGLLLIADETYERFLYDGATHASAARWAERHPQAVVVVSSFSKTYAMTGWRLGYLAGPRAVVTAVAAVQSHATSNPTSFAMAGAVAALAEAEADVERMIEEYAARRTLLVPLLNQLPGFSCVPPQGAFYAFPHVAGAFAPGRQGSVAFAEFLLERAGVAVVPGAAFGDDDHVRISFACSRQSLEEGLDRIRRALEG